MITFFILAAGILMAATPSEYEQKVKENLTAEGMCIRTDQFCPQAIVKNESEYSKLEGEQ